MIQLWHKLGLTPKASTLSAQIAFAAVRAESNCLSAFAMASWFQEDHNQVHKVNLLFLFFGHIFYCKYLKDPPGGGLIRIM